MAGGFDHMGKLVGTARAARLAERQHWTAMTTTAQPPQTAPEAGALAKRAFNVITTKAPLHERLTNLLRAAHTAPRVTQPAVMPPAMEAARNKAQHIYEAAVIAAATALVLTKAKDEKRKRRDEEAILLLLLLAGEDAYKTTHNLLGDDRRSTTGGRADPVQVEEQARAFAEARQPVLRNFAGKLAEAIRQTQDEAPADATAAETAREIRTKAASTSDVMVDVETTSTMGSVQLDRLKRAGFTTAIWNQVQRPTKRDTHAINMEMGPQPIGTLYPNGQRYPGDPAGGVGECANCLCYLEGSNRKAAA